jgi:hypothetical protein
MKKSPERIEADNNRILWLEAHFLPTIADANRDLADKCVIRPESLGLNLIYGYHLFIAKASDPDGPRTKVGAVSVRYHGDVVTNAGVGGPPKIAGPIDDPDTLLNVKRELLAWLTTWAKSNYAGGFEPGQDKDNLMDKSSAQASKVSVIC